ncbi:DUF7379 domain-containing protein [Sphingobacterium yanglingense]|uniref:Lecithin:cholesterol acyltransferase n=1 Tax=Sphingobacterium yanglingense TaxID=1437280 RepID=A0A4V3DDP2_9SPHI|nr:CHAT domain-containing protein [Sphingobacterium yanglingense]TDQ77464.1 lecithin:cholesterol acyltransferase [Sphingobacterium yanglingense]
MAKTNLPTASRIRVNGKDVALAPTESTFHNFLPSRVIALGADRSTEGQEQELDAAAIGEVQFTDGTTWTGYLGDLPDLFPDQTSRGLTSVDGWQLPLEIYSDSQDRGSIGRGVLKLLTIFSPKSNLAGETAKQLAQRTDRRIIEQEGLYKVDQEFNLTALLPSDQITGSVLLLLHGTLSSTVGSFSGLKGGTWEAIYKSYDHILCLEHFTLSVSPLDNVLAILESLPSHLTLDILSHSRGGLIGDLLTRFDSQNAVEAYGFSADEKRALVEEDGALGKVLERIAELSKIKSFTIRHFVRVACPASGTTLLGSRLDHFLNLLLNTLGLFLGSKTNLLYNVVKEFLLDIVHSRTDAQLMPGLWAMVPESVFQKINNSERYGVHSKLFVIAGDSQVGAGLGNTLSVILSNLFYWEGNDFVVDTKSMKGGLARATAVYQYLSKDEYTSHFNYFRNDNTRHCIQMGLQGITTDNKYAFHLIAGHTDSRGIDLQLKVLRYTHNNVSGDKPIVILLPGIMGSLLNDKKGNVWLNIPRILGGDFVDNLDITSDYVFADGVIAKYYKKLGEYLLKDNDVKVYPFDWRKSLLDTVSAFADLLENYLNFNQPIHIIAHSMGGLLVKQLMHKHKALWERFCLRDKNNLILLGTPWKGSHLIMEVLTGHSKRIKQLDLLDWKHNKQRILEAVNGFPGVFELLPFTDEGFQDPAFWKRLQPFVGDLVLPKDSMLNHYQRYRNETEGYDLGEAKSKVFYIAGQGDTVQGYYIKKGFFTGEVLRYTTTTEGDGSVTYDLGIPKELPAENIRYVDVSHGQLANKEVVFGHITSIMKSGQPLPTNRIRSSNRSAGLQVKTKQEEFALAGQSDDVLDTIFDTDDGAQSDTNQTETLRVSMVNADLCYANYPVMVGHFKNDGIYSAEKSLDGYLNQTLSERHKLGYYPSDIGESEVTYQGQSQPKGGLVIGLGKVDDLTPYLLSQSVEKAVIKYAFFFRDNYSNISNKQVGSTISSVIIGNSYAGLSIADSLQAIISGVQRANRKILKLDIGLAPVEELEFIDYYEDIAQLGYQTLKAMERSQSDPHIAVRPLRIGQGRKKRISADRTASWWHVFNTTALYNDRQRTKPTGLSYSSTSGRARVERNIVSSDLRIVEHLSNELSNKSTWEPKFSKSLFELLIPNDFKSILRNQNNVLWKMDEYTAQFPWEMFHYYEEEDPLVEEVPTFVGTGLIRKLITDDYRANSIMVEKDTAIVIGDPDYRGSNFRQLPAAAEEGKLVSQLVQDNGYTVTSLINASPADIIVTLFADTYKIVHVAAHGVYERLSVDGEERIVAGIVLGNGMFLEPGTINQLSAVPEFMFINCCYSGSIEGLDDKYLRHRPKLAANIGTQLIQMGVKAVVVTGWAVNDEAAFEFARKLYASLFEGYEFGAAVQRARSHCFDLYPNTNTWGAYQCYGDYYYRLTNKKSPNSNTEEPLVTSGQAIIELDNFLSYIRSKLVKVDAEILQLNTLKARIDNNHLETDGALERYALIYSELGNFIEAKKHIGILFEKDHADFSVSLVEKGFSISTKVLLQNYMELTKENESTLSLNKLADLQQQMFRLLQECRVIMTLGDTSDRLSHVGSMCKRASIIFSSTNTRQDLLLEMKTLFEKSYLKSKLSQPFVDQVYPLTNYLLASYGLAAGQALSIPEALGIGFDLDRQFDVWAARLEAERTGYINYYQFNALAKVAGCRFVFCANENKIREYYRIFEEEMINSLKIYGNVKHVKGEIEHLIFLGSIISNVDKLGMLQVLKQRLNELLI